MTMEVQVARNDNPASNNVPQNQDRVVAPILMDGTSAATEQEIAWARTIKQAAQEEQDLRTHGLSDLEYLQHAIVSKGNVNKALRRLANMQTFKDRYDIQQDGSYEQGIRDIQALLLAYPGFLKALGALENHSHVVALKMSPSPQYGQARSSAIDIRGLFLQAGHCNIAAI